MKTMKRLVITMFFVSGVSFVLQAQNDSEIETQIKKLAKTLSEQMVSGNWTVEHYAKDAISLPNNSPMLEGIEAIKASQEQMKAAGVKFTSFTATPTKIWVNGNQVTEIGTYELSLTMPQMPAPIKDKGKYLTIWEKQSDGSLKIKVDTWNTDLMPGAPQ